jgi:spore coat polysaccharide biosynthesis protein SpsF
MGLTAGRFMNGISALEKISVPHQQYGDSTVRPDKKAGKRVIIIQARMSSTRLPGKVLMDLAGRPMLAQQLRRLKCCRRADEIIVATTTNCADDQVVNVADAEQVRWYRGSEFDVLSRYLGAARESQAQMIIRVTSDCPLIDPEIVDLVIQELEGHAKEYDFAANIVERTFPRGLDTEAFFLDVLERLGRLGTSAPAREHVTYFLHYERPDLFAKRSVTDPVNNSDLRWTVDTPEDMSLIRSLYQELNLGETLWPYKDMVQYVRKNPRLMAMNAHVVQKTQ